MDACVLSMTIAAPMKTASRNTTRLVATRNASANRVMALDLTDRALSSSRSPLVIVALVLEMKCTLRGIQAASTARFVVQIASLEVTRACASLSPEVSLELAVLKIVNAANHLDSTVTLTSDSATVSTKLTDGQFQTKSASSGYRLVVILLLDAQETTTA